MKKFEAIRLANSIGQLGDLGLNAKKGLCFYRLFLELKAIHKEVSEYEDKCRSDFGIKESDNDAELVRRYNEAMAEILNEEAELKTPPFLTEEEAYDSLKKKMTFSEMSQLMPLLCITNQ